MTIKELVTSFRVTERNLQRKRQKIALLRREMEKRLEAQTAQLEKEKKDLQSKLNSIRVQIGSVILPGQKKFVCLGNKRILVDHRLGGNNGPPISIEEVEGV